MTHWKTSLQALLTVLIGLPAALSEFTGLLPHKVALGISITAAVCKLVLGQMQKDAGVVDAVVPGKGVLAMPGHETPNDPSAKPVAGA